MSNIELPELSAELEALFAAEVPIPAVTNELKIQVANRLAVTLGFGPSGGGGGFGVAAIAATVVLALGGAGLGYWAHDRDDEGELLDEREASSHTANSFLQREGRPADPTAAPSWFGEPTRPERKIRGVVLLDGEAVAGATVTLTSDLTQAGLALPPTTESDREGRFDFELQRAAHYDVSASLAGHGFGTASVEGRNPGGVLEVTIELSGCANRLGGAVRDASGGVVVGASVWWTRGWWADLRPLVVGAVSDQDGAYELCLPAGPSMINVTAAGYGAIAVNETVFGRRERDITLLPEATVRGRVLTDSGEPLAQVRVELGPTRWVGPSRTSIEFTTTDTEGRFRFDGITPGRHRVSLADRQRVSPIVPVTLEAGQESDEVVLVARDRHRISIEVTESGKPVSGARVFAYEQGRRPASSRFVADEDGKAVVSLTRPAVVSFHVRGFEVIAPSVHEALASHTRAKIQVVRAAALSGIVTSRGVPVSGSKVTAIHLGSSHRVDATSDRRGHFEISGLEAGRYNISAISHQLPAFSGESSVTVELSQGQHRESIEVRLDGAGSIAGRVVDGDGQPVGDVLVQYSRDRGDDRCTATTDRRGEFVCPMLAGFGTYRASVKPGRGSAIVFAPKGAAHADIAMNDGAEIVTGQQLEIVASKGTVSGRVVSTAGGPLPDATILASETSMAFNPMNAPWRGYARATSDANGRFSIDVWSGSEYLLQGSSPSGGRGTAKARAGQRSTTIVLVEPGRVIGRLLGFPSTPELHIRRRGNNTDFWTGRVNGDRFDFDAIPPGDYAILALSGSDGAATPVRVQSGETIDVLVTARGTTSLHGRVLDFASGAPVKGVRCMVSAYLRGAGVAGYGTPIAPTDASGAFTVESPTGPIEIHCAGNPVRHSEGAARLKAVADKSAEVKIFVVVSDTPRRAANGIGARFLFEDEESRIAQLRPRGQAAAAGLRVGDVVTQINGRDATMLTDFALERYLGTFAIGESVILRLRRADRQTTATVQIEGPWVN